MKRLHKQTGITVRLTRSERARLREAARLQTRIAERKVTPSELLRDGGLWKANEIIAAAQTAAPDTAAA